MLYVRPSAIASEPRKQVSPPDLDLELLQVDQVPIDSESSSSASVVNQTPEHQEEEEVVSSPAVRRSTRTAGQHANPFQLLRSITLRSVHGAITPYPMQNIFHPWQ